MHSNAYSNQLYLSMSMLFQLLSDSAAKLWTRVNPFIAITIIWWFDIQLSVTDDALSPTINPEMFMSI